MRTATATVNATATAKRIAAAQEVSGSGLTLLEKFEHVAFAAPFAPSHYPILRSAFSELDRLNDVYEENNCSRIQDAIGGLNQSALIMSYWTEFRSIGLYL